MDKISQTPDGTEGYASITLTLKKPDSEIKTIACIIKNDFQLQELQRENKSKIYAKIHKRTKFFLYFFCSESNLSKRLVKSEIVAHRFTKPTKDKNCIIENKWEKTPFFLKNHHVFLPACHEDLKTVECDKYLTNYGRTFTFKNLSVGKYRGVQSSNVPVEYRSFSLSNRNNELNITDSASTVFQNLVHGPLFLFEEASKSWSLIGWYKKAPEEDRITVYHLGTQDTTDIWKTSSSNQPEVILPTQPSPDPPASNDQSNQSESADPPTSTDQLNQFGSADPPTSTHQSDQSGSDTGAHSPNNAQALQDFLNKECVLDCLAIHLDIDYNSKNKNWRQLADEMKAPQDIKDKCKCKTVHSPTLTLLERPDVQNKTIEELMNVTQNITYVSKFLKKKFPGAEDRSKSIKEGLCCNPKLKDAFATKLDRQPFSRVTKNWRDVGSLLGIDEDELDLIEKGGHNPAEKLLLNAYKSLPPAKTKAKEFRAIIMGFTKRKDLHNLLVELGITENDDRPLKNVIPPNSENMKKMTAALNKSSPGLQNWKNLASSWDSDSDHFDYPAEQSPTKTLLEWVRDSMDHEVTVDEFLNILGDKMKRYDVKRELEKLIKKLISEKYP